MPSAWLSLDSALTTLQDADDEAEWSELKERLVSGDVEARAAVVERQALTLSDSHFQLPRGQKNDEPIYLGSVDRWLSTPEDLSLLPEGVSQRSYRGDVYSFERKGSRGTIYWVAHTGAQPAERDIHPDFWKDAVVDVPESEGVSDNLRSRVRTRASGIVLNRGGI